MGIVTTYSMKIKTSPKSKKTIEDVINDLYEFDVKSNAKMAFNLDGSSNIEMNWNPENVIELFVQFSINHMDVLFTITAITEEYDCHEKMYFFQGKHYVDQGVIVYPEFDKRKLA